MASAELSDIRVSFSNNDLSVYERWNYKWWYALAEFVDNSTHSYYENRSELEESYKKNSTNGTGFEVRITTGKNDDGSQKLTIYDNAFGMGIDALTDAFDFGRPKHNPGRSQYGLGMKTAGIWVGPDFEIQTSMLGSNKKYTVTFNKNDAQSGADLPVKEEEARLDEHFTLITFSRVRNPLIGRTKGKTKEYLGNIYRYDINEGNLVIEFDDDTLVDPVTKWIDTHGFLKDTSGNEYRREFDEFSLDGGKRNITGWAGILYKGKRKMAGFAQVANDRIIQGFPHGWRPEAVFGFDSPNDLINQRLIGEFRFEGFTLSQTKDLILLTAEEEEAINSWLLEQVRDYMAAAKSARTRGGAEVPGGPSEEEIVISVNEVKEELESDRSAVVHDEEPLPDFILSEQHNEYVGEFGEKEPFAIVEVGSSSIGIYIANKSKNDPYMEFEHGAEQGELNVFINMAHPIIRHVDFKSHLKHCMTDALSAQFVEKYPEVAESEFAVRKYKDERLRIIKTELED